MLCPDAANREQHDYYPTPPGAVTPLLARERFTGSIWEPACGCGAMSRTLEQAGYLVRSSDLIDRGFGAAGVDFLQQAKTWGDNVVTNPPFKLAREFVEHALSIVPGKVAVLARLQWLESGPRQAFFRAAPFARLYVFSTRVPFQRGRLVDSGEGGGRMVAYAWFIFDPSHIGPAVVDWLDYDDSWRAPAEDMFA
jgi:hypothetical protein